MKKVLVTVDHQFVRTPDGRVWVKTIYGYDFWRRYLEVFDAVRIVCRLRDVERLEEEMLLSSGDNVEFFALPQYRGPKEFILRYFKIRQRMKSVADGCSCAIFRIPSPIAGGVKNEVVKAGLPWAVEVVNDPWDTFAPGSFKGFARPFVRFFFTRQVKQMAMQANGASYVTQYALQKRYPNYAMVHGEDERHFQSYYSSIILKDEYFYDHHELHKPPYTIIHVNSCITDYSKGHDVVLKVLKSLRDKGLDVRVVFVGDGPARLMFEKMAEDLGVRQYCEFKGLISKPMELRQRLIDADIMVFPTKGEGLPRCIIEAMAVGLPCLSTPVNGIPELLPEDCLFEQQDIEAFTSKCIDLFNSSINWKINSNENHMKSREFNENLLNIRRKTFYGCLFDIS